MRRLLPALLGLPLLTACPGPPPPPPVGSICAQGVGAADLRASGGLALSVPAAVMADPAPSAPDWQAERVAGEVLILSDPDAPALRAQALSVLAGISVQAVVPGLLRAQTPRGEDDRAFARRLAAAGLRVQPNYVYRSLAVPNDPGFPGNGGVQVSGRNVVQDYLTRVRAPEAWAFLQGCGKALTGVRTAIVDSGVDASHPDLAGRVLPPLTVLPDGALNDSTGHGTAIAGMIGAATNNALGLAGLTWQGTNLLSVKVLGSGGASTSTAADGLRRAVNAGAKVVNFSLGLPGMKSDEALDRELAFAESRDVLVVAAAGNTEGEGLYYPALVPTVLAVGAVGARDDELACYSARARAGETRSLDLVAPGGAGLGFCAGARAEQDLLVLAPGGGYTLQVGTSFSAPLVSGVAALMRAANPSLTAAQTRALLKESADRRGGLPLLDAEAAVRAATR